MPDDRVVLDVFLVTVTIPRNHPAFEVIKIRRTLNRLRFATRLQNCVATLIRALPSLTAIDVSVPR